MSTINEISEALIIRNGNEKLNDLALPMDYQSSLGTFDLIFGAGYDFKGLQVMGGFRQPLTQNKNQFLASNYTAELVFQKFQSIN